MCERVSFTASGSRAQCVSGPCHRRPEFVTCVGEDTGDFANWMWKCSASLRDGLELSNPHVSCYDRTRCEGSSCSVKYSLVYSYPPPSMTWTEFFVTLILLLVVLKVLLEICTFETRPRRRYYYSPYVPFFGDTGTWFFGTPNPPRESTHRSTATASGPSFSGASNESTAAASGPSFSGASNESTATASGPSFSGASKRTRR